jgi:hypothetical protein
MRPIAYHTLAALAIDPTSATRAAPSASPAATPSTRVLRTAADR